MAHNEQGHGEEQQYPGNSMNLADRSVARATYHEPLRCKANQAISTYKKAIITQELKTIPNNLRKLDTHIKILNAGTSTALQKNSSGLQIINEELAFHTMKAARQMFAEGSMQSAYIKGYCELCDSNPTTVASGTSEQENSVLERFRTSPFVDLDFFIQYERDMSELKHYRKSVPVLTKRFYQLVRDNEQMEQALEENELEVSKLRELKSEVTKDLAMADARGLVWQSEIRELEEALEAHMGLANVGAHVLGGLVNFWIRYAPEAELLWRGAS